MVSQGVLNLEKGRRTLRIRFRWSLPAEVQEGGSHGKKSSLLKAPNGGPGIARLQRPWREVSRLARHNCRGGKLSPSGFFSCPNSEVDLRQMNRTKPNVIMGNPQRHGLTKSQAVGGAVPSWAKVRGQGSGAPKGRKTTHRKGEEQVFAMPRGWVFRCQSVKLLSGIALFLVWAPYLKTLRQVRG